MKMQLIGFLFTNCLKKSFSMRIVFFIFSISLSILAFFLFEKPLQAASENQFTNPYLSLIMHQNTIHCTSLEDVFARYAIDTARYPSHVSFITGQSEKFIAYDLIARAVFQTFHPGEMPVKQLENQVFLRYPDQKAPKNLAELFRKVPLEDEDYDTASTLVADYLVAASPSLEEDDADESAIAIARSNDRDQLIQEVVSKLFMKEGIPLSLFKDPINSLLKEIPSSDEGGIITRIFLPQSAPLHQVAYRALAYGLPYRQTDLEDSEAFRLFCEEYQSGKRWVDDPIPQVRFLPSGLRADQGFDLEAIHMVRYTCLSSEALSGYAEKVHQVVQDIFNVYQAQTQELEIRKILFLQSKEKDEQKQMEGQWLIQRYLEYFDPWSAWECLSQFTDRSLQDLFLSSILQILLVKEDFVTIDAILKEKSDDFPEKNKFLVQLALYHLDCFNKEEVNKILIQLPPSPERNFLLLMTPREFQVSEYNYSLCPDFPTTLEELMTIHMLTTDNEENEENDNDFFEFNEQ